eukprot:SM000044S16005  [mRNA]  locus=s44:514126:517938:+ [translate_table: standard]
MPQPVGSASQQARPDGADDAPVTVHAEPSEARAGPPGSRLGDEEGEEDEDDDEDPSAATLPPALLEEEAMMGFRAAFPLSFGKQEGKAVPLEKAVSTTRRESGGGIRKDIVASASTTIRIKTDSAVLPTANSVRGGQPGAGNPGTESAAPRMGASAAGSGNGVFLGPPRPLPHEAAPSVNDAEGDSEDEDDEHSDEDEYRVPVSNEVVLRGHSKVVSALAIDPTGSRVLTGSYDYTVRMYDFEGMDSKLRSFRQLEPSEGHQVRALSWSPSADLFLAVTGSAQAKPETMNERVQVYDRDGYTQGEFLRGDMYIRDLKNTKGHLSGLTGGEWHPRERHTALTCSEDGSLRIWDVTNFKTQKQDTSTSYYLIRLTLPRGMQVIKPKLARPGRVPVNSCTWGHGGKCIAGGLGDGSIQVWNVKAGFGSRPDLHASLAHEAGEEVTSILFSSDGTLLLSRGTDGTLKVWDTRKFKSPVKEFTGLPNSYSQTNIAWSPDERLAVTAVSSEKGFESGGGQLAFFDVERLECVRRVGIHPVHSVVRVAWHPRLNQIFATIGDKKEGGTHILYDPALSERGALVCVARAPRKKSAVDFQARPAIHNPHALPLFREEPGRKRQREKARSDPIKSKRPDLPVEGAGHGGRVGKSKGSLLTQYLLREGGLIKETWMEEDPREAILRHAEAAAADPQIIAPAYAQTQPKPVFQEEEEEDEDH